MTGEFAYGKLNAADLICYHWWTSANFGDTMFTSQYPINPKFAPQADDGNIFPLSASSFHPGGANFGFADGSVHFLKDSISSWSVPSGSNPPNTRRAVPLTRSSLAADAGLSGRSAPATAAKSSARIPIERRLDSAAAASSGRSAVPM